MNKTTDELFKIISKNKNLESILKESKEDLLKISLNEYLEELLLKKKLIKADVIAKSNLNANYAYQIFSGIKKEPSRDKMLALCIGMELSPDEAQNLLKVAQLSPLYPRVQRDLIIIFSLKEKLNIIKCNELLFDSGCVCLK